MAQATQESEEGPLEKVFFESDVRRKLQIARDVGWAIARQSPEVAASDADAFHRGYEKAIELLGRMFLGRAVDLS
ncbi:MAG: hypothetical protein KIT87_18340 [Anaerolineae bacterium]|nr:hypothetical protein [Anaerolineae bacterium]